MGKTAYLKKAKLESEQQTQKLPTLHGWADAFDAALGGETAHITTGGATDIDTEEASRPRIKISGTLTSNATVSFPVPDPDDEAGDGGLRQWIVHNNTTGDFSVTVILAGGAGIKIPQGLAIFVSHDGTNIIAPQTMTSAFTAPSMLNSWAYYNPGAANLYHQPGYRINNGYGEARGIIAGGTLTQKAFDLPFKLRPAKDVIFTTVSNNAFGAGTIYANGEFTPAVGSTTWFSIDGIRWPLA